MHEPDGDGGTFLMGFTIAWSIVGPGWWADSGGWDGEFSVWGMLVVDLLVVKNVLMFKFFVFKVWKMRVNYLY
jgi:hypothetical protein